MRIRSVKPEFFQDENMATVSAETALLAIGLNNYADDEGYFNANPKLIHAQIFPLREPSMSVHGMLMELSRIQYIEIRTIGKNRATGRIVDFGSNQVISRPRKSELRKHFERAAEDSMSNHGAIPDASLNTPWGLEGIGMDREWIGGDRGGKNTETAQTSQTPPPPLNGGSKVGRKKPKTSSTPADHPEPVRLRMIAVGEIMRRPPETQWTAKELEALKNCGLLGVAAEEFDAQVGAVRAFYRAAVPESQQKNFWKRTVLPTLLNNWPSELDKSRAWAREHTGPGGDVTPSNI